MKGNRGGQPATPHLVDTHCHLDLYNSPADLVRVIDAGRVATIAVTNTPSVFQWTAALVKGSRYIRPAVGLHPQLAAQRVRELDSMWPLLEETRFVGEVGLDYTTTDLAERHVQRQVFSQILERCAPYGDRVLTVHSRRAAADVVAALGEGFPGRIILHWYSGSLGELEKAIQKGCYFSVNPAMVTSQNGQRLIARMPLDRVLTETDGPFIQVGKRPVEPSDVSVVIDYLAQQWGVEGDAAVVAIAANFRTLLLRR